MRALAAWFVLLLVPSLAFAQNNSLRGKFQDVTSHAPVSGVQVTLKSFADTSDVHKVTGKDDGSFEIPALGDHSYKLEATRLGYSPLKIVIRVTKKNQDAGVLALTPESIPVSGVTVTESPAPAIQKADTTEYRAGAVKVHKDATAEDLVQKLPGVTMENGQIKAQGENVQNVLVNGRPFFGSDPTAAMRNLPAEVVDRIQVYDKASDQAEFSGFDDNQSQKTMNFVLRDLKARFGKVYGGYGDQDRYQGGGSLTLLRGPSRVTMIGMSNNINQRNFSIQDLFGGLTGTPGGAGGPRIMMFGGGGGGAMMHGGGSGGGNFTFRMGGGGFGGGGFDPSSFLVGQQPGVSTTHSGGMNYVGQYGPTLSVSSSAFLNSSDNENVQTLTRQYLPPQDSISFYDQRSNTDSNNGNQRFDARVEWTPDSTSSAILQPRLYWQQSDAMNDGAAANSTDQGFPRSTALSHTSDSNDGDNFSNRLTLRHRFGKRGRNVSAQIDMGHTIRNGDGTQYSLTDYVGSSASNDTLDQQSNSKTTTNSISTRIAFTEPLIPHLQAQLIYNPSLTRSVADARALSLDPLSQTYSLPESALSNSYESRHTTQNGGLSLLLTEGPWKLLGSTSYQHARLQSDQTFPFTNTIDRTFDDVLPSLTLSGNFPKARRNMRLSWSTSTNPPSIGQLQNVVNNSNPLSLSTGNPALRPTYTNSLSLRLSEADPLHSKSKFLFANVARTSHPIANSTFTAPFDTTVNGVFLPRGTQLTAPVNLKESWNGNLFGVYSRPLKMAKSILSLNGGGTWTRTPSRINGLENIGSTYAIRSGIVLASNISPNLDFTVSYWSTYNISRSTLSTNNTGDYFTHNAGLRLNAVAPHGIVVRQELNHNLQSGVPSAYGQDVVLWNTTLGKKFLKDDRGELRLTLTDALEQNRSVSRSVTDSYVQDSRDRTLGRFVQAVFTYTFRSI